MKSRKEKRDVLFAKSKPIFKPADVDLLNWMWTAYKMSGQNGVDEATFKENQTAILSQYSRLSVAVDRNDGFRGHAGPVCLIASMYDGWRLEPHIQWFPWATPRNKVRVTVGLLIALRHSQDVGVTVVRSDEKNAEFFHRLKRYVPIYHSGSIRFGRPGGADVLFSVRGKRTHVISQ